MRTPGFIIRDARYYAGAVHLVFKSLYSFPKGTVARLRPLPSSAHLCLQP